LAAKNYPCPSPIKNKRGELLGTYKRKSFALFEFMEGSHRKKPNPKIIMQAIAKLHKTSIGYKPKYSEARDTYDQKSSWENAVKNAKKMSSKTEAKNRLAWLHAELKKLEFPNGLPKGVCHCDTHYSNFLYKNGKISAVLDFDDASYIAFLYDI